MKPRYRWVDHFGYWMLQNALRRNELNWPLKLHTSVSLERIKQVLNDCWGPRL